MQSYILQTNPNYLSLDQLVNAINFPATKLIPDYNYLMLTADKTTIGISQVKQAIVWMKTFKTATSGKLLVIATADLLTVEAQNALLKLIEEPGEGNRIVLTTAFPDVLLPTILSRCLLLTKLFKPTGTSSLTSENEKLFTTVLNHPATTTITTIDSLGITKDNQLARQFLLDFIEYLQNHAITRTNLIRQILYALDLLNHNVNTRLTIETLLLDLPSLR